MPYSIEKRDTEWCVIKDDDGKSMGCHDTEGKAQDQLTALNIAEAEKACDDLALQDATKADEEIDTAYRRFHEVVNMSASELEAWADTDCSKLASLTREPIARNLRLLQTPKDEWTSATARSANRTVSFVERMRGAEQGDPVREGCPSKRDISLRNWAYNPSKKAVKMMTENMAYSQTEVNYSQVSATAGQACANCRWFKEAPEGGYCHIVELYPLAIRQTGHCDKWTAAKVEEEQPEQEIEIEIEAPEPAAEIEMAMMNDDKGGKQSLWQMFRKLFEPDKPEALHSSFKVVGNHWFGTWSNNVQDRDGEWFSSKAIEDYIDRVTIGIVPLPELQVWHVGSAARIGQATMLGTLGKQVKMVWAIGTFDDTPQAQKAKLYYSSTKRQHGMSHGFTFDPAKFIDNTYHSFNTFELSVLPLEKAANPFTSFESKGKKMNPEQEKYFRDVFGEKADEIIKATQAKSQALEELGAAFKDFAEPTGASPETPEVTQAVANAESNLKELAIELSSDLASVVETQLVAAKAIKALQDANAALVKQLQDTQNEVATMKAKFANAPRLASKSEATIADDNHPLVQNVQAAEKKFDNLWGVTLKGN